ncbi:MAG: SpoIIE family protein phosphatase [bacterium]|nr:SpoIIE family protein phosphatase [bacterium]
MFSVRVGRGPLIVPILFLLAASRIAAEPGAILPESAYEYRFLGSAAQVWYDKDGDSISLPEAKAGEASAFPERHLAAALAADPEYRTAAADIVNFGAGGGAVWLRFHLRNADEQESAFRWLVVENPRLWEIDLFEFPQTDVSPAALISHRRAGNSRAFARREIDAPPFYFALNLEPGQAKTYYVRFWNRTTLQLPLAIATDAARVRNENLRKYMYGAFLGFFAALLIYNLLMFVTLRERNYLYYMLLLGFMGLFVTGYLGLNFQFLTPDFPNFNYASIPALGILCLFSVVLFTQDYLHTARHTPRLHRFLQGLCGVFGIALVFNLFGDTHTSAVLATASSLVLAVVMIYGAAYLWSRKRYRPARYYLISWGVFYASLLIHGAIQFGLFTNAFLLNHALMIGASLATILLSLGMAARIKTLDRARYALVTQLEVAKDIQRALLPPPLADRDDLRVAYLYEPMEAVGGDFIDLHIREDGRALFAVADVTGHGVPAALLSSMIKMALRVSYEVMEDPALALGRLHDAIKDKLASHHITVSFCYVDLKTGLLRHASAGHLPPLLVRADGSLEVLESTGMLLHPLIAPNSQTIEAQLRPGDRIVMYTDGITETESVRGALFGEERLRELVVELRELEPGEMLQEIFQYARLFSGNDQAPLFDDFTLLAFEYRGAERGESA